MIRPRLPKVASGTRLTTNLVNNIINRTEYAADLLRQYKLVAGTGMYVEPHYDGTRVSYLQPVGGGVRPSPISPIGYSLVGYYGYDGVEAIPFIYQNGEYTTLVNPFPNFNSTYPYAIRNGVIAGFFYWGENDFYYGFSTSFYIKNNNWFYFRHPNSGPLNQPVNTEAYGTDGLNIVGWADTVFIDNSPYYPAFVYEIETGQISTFYNPSADSAGNLTEASDIYKNIIIGRNGFNLNPTSRAFIYSNNTFTNFTIENKQTYATGIYENKIVGWVQQPSNFAYNGFIYENGNYQIITHPNSGTLNTIPGKIFNNNICGYYNDAEDGNRLKGFVYDGTSWQTIMYPGSEYTVVYGIG